MDFKLKVGDKLPVFSAMDQEAIVITNQMVKGMCTVLCFYSNEENSLLLKFRDKLKQFEELGSVVIAIYPTSVEKQKQIYESNHLNFILLSDQSLSMCKAFDVVKKVEGKGKIVPSTFLIDRDGVIRWIERPIQLAGHTERILEAVNRFNV